MKPPRKTPPGPPRILTKPPRPPRPERAEVKYHGIAACIALWNRRSDDVLRVYVERSCLDNFSELLKACSKERKPYHVVDADDLERLTETVHHGGICILALEHRSLTLEQLRLVMRDNAKRQLLVYLDGVENPHNLGAIVRSCAHFGASFVLGAKGQLPRLSPSACRIAEGGAEHVTLVPLDKPLADLNELIADGFTLVGTSVTKGKSVYEFKFPPRVILVMGAESEGMSDELQAKTADVIRIPGTGAVESLNVSVAFAVFASEFFRIR